MLVIYVKKPFYENIHTHIYTGTHTHYEQKKLLQAVCISFQFPSVLLFSFGEKQSGREHYSFLHQLTMLYHLAVNTHGLERSPFPPPITQARVLQGASDHTGSHPQPVRETDWTHQLANPLPLYEDKSIGQQNTLNIASC